MSCRWNCRSNDFHTGIALGVQLLLAMPVAAADIPDRPAASQLLSPESPGQPDQAEEILFLEVWLNEVPTRQLAEFRAGPEGLAIRGEALAAIGLLTPARIQPSPAWIALSKLHGLKWALDRSRQLITLTAPVALLSRGVERIGAPSEDGLPVPHSSLPAMLLNYDLFARNDQGMRSLSAWSNLRFSGLGAGTVNHSMLSQVAHSPTGNRTQHVRLDTAYSQEWPGSAVQLVLGDTQTSTAPWARSLRIGGFRLGRDFSLQPYQSTAPAQIFRGEAAIPSTVELYVNGLKQATQQVPPGMFEIEHIPSMQGAGNAQVVVTDIHGVRRTVAFDVYGVQSLLKQGLWDWSVEGGLVRQRYGLASWDYGHDMVLTGSLRHGWSDDFTPNAHVEWTHGLALAGVGGTIRLGRQAGTATGFLATSRTAHGTGTSGSLGYQWNTHGMSFSAVESRRSALYRDVASMGAVPGAVRTSSLGVGMGTAWGQWSANYIQQWNLDRTRTRLVSVNWSRSLGVGATAYASLAMDLQARGGGRTLGFSVSWPLEGRRQAFAGYRTQGGRSSATLEAAQYPDTAQGWGWRLQGDHGGAGYSNRAEVSHISEHGYWSGGISHARGERSPGSYLSGSGSLFVGAGQIKTGARSDLSFAVVSTSGIPGVPVRLENRLVGVTDARGQLFVPQLSPYQRNRIEIDTMDLAPDIRADAVVQDVVPQRNGGAPVHFSLRKVIPIELQAYGETGELVPAGLSVVVERRRAEGQSQSETYYTFVGHDGRIYLENPQELINLHITGGKTPCTITLLNIVADPTQAVQTAVCRRQPRT